MASWVDHKNYFGPDRRKKRGVRLRERREYDYGGNPPSLSAAVRQLRMHVIEAHGPDAERFIQRLDAVAVLADSVEETAAAGLLRRIAAVMRQNGERDMRNALYNALDKVQEAIVRAS